MRQVEFYTRWIIVIALLPTLGQAQIDSGRPTIIDRSIVVPKANFNLSNIRNLARNFLQENKAASTSLLRLLIASDQASLSRNLVHGLPGSTYRSTVDLISHAGGLPTGPLARILAVGGKAKLSYLEGGTLTEENLSAVSDPTIIQQGSYRYELLHFRVTKAGSALSGDKYFLDVYLKASPGVSVRGCLRVFEILRDITKIDNLSIHVRSDAWFMEDDQYPLVAAFTRPLAIPNELDYLTASRLTCSFVRDKVRCSGQNFVE